jgi:[ribosomal protein S5]-alanine N-acetyltransferase
MTTDLTKVVIETDRLKLIPTSLKYAPEIFKEFTKQITTYMHPKAPKEIKETEAFINSSVQKIENGEELQVVILDKKTGEFLGHGGITKLKTDTPELGIWIKKSAHGNKYGREAVKALKEWVEHNLKYKYIIYPVDKRNIPSRKIAESLGGVVEDEYKKENMSGNILDEVEYRIYPQKSP